MTACGPAIYGYWCQQVPAEMQARLMTFTATLFLPFIVGSVFLYEYVFQLTVGDAPNGSDAALRDLKSNAIFVVNFLCSVVSVWLLYSVVFIGGH